MPKNIKTIVEFDGGFVDFSASRDIADKESVDLQNFAVRNIGRLKLLGCSVSNSTTIPDIPAAHCDEGRHTTQVGCEADDNHTDDPQNAHWVDLDVDLNSGASFFTYGTDVNWSRTESAEQWIVFVDRADGQLWLLPKSQIATPEHAWKTNGFPYFPSQNSISAKIGIMSIEPGFYFADGNLRVSNPNDAVDSDPPVVANGCSSLWIGYIKRNYMVSVTTNGQATADAFFCYGAPLQKPNLIGPDPDGVADDVGNFHRFSSYSEVVNAETKVGAVITDGGLGEFALKVAIERGKGDGTLKFQGRKIYVTYTYDGNQESLPVPLGTITSAMLPAAPTASALGYNVETIAGLVTPHGSGELKLNRDVRVQRTLDDDGDGDAANPDFKNWDPSGTVTVLDANGKTQSLQYSGIVDDTYSVASVSASSGTYTVTTTNEHNINNGDIVTISGNASGTINLDIEEVLIDGSNKVVSSTNQSGKTFNIATGNNETFGTNSDAGMTCTVYNQCKLSGVIGWVDTGYCNYNNVIEEIVIENDGLGYTEGTYNHDEDGGGTQFLIIDETHEDDDFGASAFAATIVVTEDEEIESITITNHGSGFIAGEIPAITVAGMGTPSVDAILRPIMSGTLNTENFCTSLNGTWNAADIPASYGVEFDPPGEIEQQDENLGMRLILSGSPHSSESIIDPIYGGNRLTHINFYTNKFEDDAGTIPEIEDFAYITSFNMVKGWKEEDGNYRPWLEDTTTNTQATVYSDYFGSMFSDNFQGRTGMFPDTESMTCRWKTATILNRRVYAGNVYMDDGTGTDSLFPDRILKSIPNKFDTFPIYDTLDVVVDDGDEIVLLEQFGGKLLQFKKETLYVLDVTTEPEYLSGSFKYRGIPSRAAAKRTDFGVVFANKYGAFMFNGDEIKQLVQNKIEDYWASWYTDDISVVFNPYKNYAIFTISGKNDFLIHDFITGSWVKGNGNRIPGDALDISDWFIYEGEMNLAVKGMTANEIGFYKWSDDAVTTLLDESDNAVYISKEMAFDTPLTDTRIYKVKMTYKTDGSAANIKAQLLHFDGNSETELDLGNLTSTSSSWYTQEFSISPSITCKTAKLKLTQKTTDTPLSIVAITTADAGAAINIETATNTIETDDFVEIKGTVNYDGIYKATKIDTENFKVVKTYVSDEAVGKVYTDLTEPNVGFEINDIAFIFRSKRIK